MYVELRSAAQLRGEAGELHDQLLEARLRVLHEVHLVDRHHQVWDPQQRADERVSLRLLQHALARVQQDHGEVRRRGARHHVARVLLVAGAVGDDEPPPGRREVAVRHVDRDPLLALGAQAVGQQREVQRAGAAAPRTRLRDVLELVLEHLLAVIQQPADQRALAVVHGARGCEAQQIEGHRRVSSPLADPGWPGAPAPCSACGGPLRDPSLPPLVGGLIKSPTRSTPPSCGPPSRPLRCGRPRASRRAR